MLELTERRFVSVTEPSGRSLERIQSGRRYFVTAAPDNHTVWDGGRGSAKPVASFLGTPEGRREAISEFNRLEALPEDPVPDPPPTLPSAEATDASRTESLVSVTDSVPRTAAAPFSGNPDRTIRLDVVPFGKVIARSVFQPNELGWVDAEVDRVAQHPALWVPALMAHLEAHRQMKLDIGKLARGSVGLFGVRRGFPLRAEFVARWNVYETLWRHYLAHKAELALELQAHPYEAEVLRNSKYFGPAISGIQVEFTKTAQGPGNADETKTCPFCAEVIKAKAVLCRFCNRDLPSDSA